MTQLRARSLPPTVPTVDNMDDYEISLALHRSKTRDLIESWSHTPAVLVDRHLEVLHSNPLARALSESFWDGANLARFTFLHPDVTRTADCWEDTAEQVAAMLRGSLEQHEQDRAFLAIVGELSAKSWDFSDAWAKNEQPRSSGVATFLDTEVGEVTLGYHLTRVPENYDDTLILFGPADAESKMSLERLAAAVGSVGA